MSSRREPQASAQALIVFVKDPVAGRVKTRLVPVLGKRRAAALYRSLAEAVLRQTAPGRDWVRVVRHAPATAASRIGRWLPREDCRPQRGRSLGQRMSHAVTDTFDEGARRVVLVGSDLPELRRRHVLQAFAALSRYDLVLGPARDGGYYLVGLRRPLPELFRGVRWSRSDVLARTRSKARALGLRVALLEELSDLDTPSDLRRLWPREVSTRAAGSASRDRSR